MPDPAPQPPRVGNPLLNSDLSLNIAKSVKMAPFPRVTDFESWKEHFMLNVRTECAIAGVQHWVAKSFQDGANYADFMAQEPTPELQRLDGHLMKLIARIVETNLATEDGKKNLSKMGDDGASIRSLSLKLQKIIVDNQYEVSGRLLLMVINDHYTTNGRDRYLPVHAVRDVKISGKSVEDLVLLVCVERPSQAHR